MHINHIHQGDTTYPDALQKYLGDHAPASITVLGNLDILRHESLALFCSIKCPGNLILKTYDFTNRLQDMGVTVISGFHSPIERECLRILIRGTQPIIICPARSIERMQIRAEYKRPLEEGRLLLLSPFDEKLHRSTIQTALYRNYFVGALAKRIFVTYAEPQSKTEQSCRDILAWDKPLYTFESDKNTNLIAMGAKSVNPDNIHLMNI